MIDIDTLNPEIIDSLVTDQVPEGRALDYKRELHGDGDDAKKEFLADVSAFANAAGGLILYGVEEEKDATGKTTGIPKSAPGIPSLNSDFHVRRLENQIRDGIEPRIPGVRFRTIDRSGQAPVLALQVRQSWVRPHMVTYKGTSRFYSRNTAGKYPLDVGEIPSAFLLSDQLGERIRRFRLERLDLIMAGDTPAVLVPGTRVVLYLIAIEAFDPALPLVSRVPIYDQGAQLVPETARLSPLGLTGANQHHFNFDGLLWTTSHAKNEQNRSYLQIFRNGAIETVWSPPKALSSQTPWFPGAQFELASLNALRAYLPAFKTWGLDGPFVLMVSLLNVKGLSVVHPEALAMLSNERTIDREVLIVPDVWLEHADVDPEQTLRPVLSVICQAAGHPNKPWS